MAPPQATVTAGNGFTQQDLLTLARQPMPFGKYRGRRLIDLPEAYLLWFAARDFPAGELGRLLQLALELKRNGLGHLLQPLKR